MNENLNLVEILKDCPKGIKLYSTVYGDVEFNHIENNEYPIVVGNRKGFTFRLAKDGKYLNDFNGECTLFPSKEQRDWSKFKPTCEFKDGDILSYQNARLSNRTIYIYRYHKRFNTSYYVALSFDPKKSLMICNKGGLALNAYDLTVRFATEEEKQKLFKAIKDNGYEWNAGTKTLKKLVKPKPKFKVGDKIVNILMKYMVGQEIQGIISEITDNKYVFTDGSYIFISSQDSWELVPNKKPKFDPKTLNPFDKVLVFDSDRPWTPLMFSYLEYSLNYPRMQCFDFAARKVIPYNKETEHLLGTYNEAPEFYRYWED